MTMIEAVENDAPDWAHDPIHAHWQIHDDIAKRFALIFGIKARPGMLRRLNNLRYDSTMRDAAGDYVASPWSERLRTVDALSKLVVTFVHKDVHLYNADDENASFYAKTFHDMCMILYRHAKHYRRANRPVPLSLLTNGTTIEFYVEHGRSKEPELRTVSHIRVTDMGYCIVHCHEKRMEHGNTYVPPLFPHSVPDTFNSAHITKVLKHVPGVPRYKGDDEEVAYKESAELQYSKYDATSRYGKRSGHYVNHGSTWLFHAEVERLGINDCNQRVDIEAMARAFFNADLVKVSKVGEGHFYLTQHKIKRRIFKRWVRQNVNRFLLSRSEQERREEEYQKEMDAEYAKDMAHDDTW